MRWSGGWAARLAGGRGVGRRGWRGDGGWAARLSHRSAGSQLRMLSASYATLSPALTSPTPHPAPSTPPLPCQDLILADRFEPCLPTATCNGPCCTVDKLPPHLHQVEATAAVLGQGYLLLK